MNRKKDTHWILFGMLLAIFIVSCTPNLLQESITEKEKQEIDVADSSVLEESIPENKRVLEAQQEQNLEKSIEIECRLSQTSFEISEGGLFQLQLVSNAKQASLQLKGLPFQSVFWKEELSYWVRIPYQTLPVISIQATLFCDTQIQQQTITLTIMPLKWEKITDQSAGGPSAREHTRLWFDETNPDQLWLWGGIYQSVSGYKTLTDLWNYDFSTQQWTSVANPAIVPIFLGTPLSVKVEKKDTILVLGGREKTTDNPRGYWFHYRKNHWEKIEKINSFRSELSLLVHDVMDSQNNFWIFGGYDSSRSERIHSQLYRFRPDNEEAWGDISQTNPPSGRYGAAFVLDKKNHRLIVHSGGQKPVVASNTVNASQETWELDLTTRNWRLLSPSEPSSFAVPVFRNACFAMDPIGQRMFILGGTPDAKNANKGLYILHLDKGKETWVYKELKNEPDSRASCSATYDFKRKQILFGYGNNIQKFHNDIFALKLGN